MDESFGVAAATKESAAADPRFRFRWIGWSSFFMAFVQSVCAAFAALSGLRLLIGAAAFAAATGAVGFADRHLHIDAIRVPMVLLALAGALFNLLALWQVRRLRVRSAAGVAPEAALGGQIEFGEGAIDAVPTDPDRACRGRVVPHQVHSRPLTHWAAEFVATFLVHLIFAHAAPRVLFAPLVVF